MPGYLIIDVETSLRGELLKSVKYRDIDISPDEAITLAKREALDASGGRKDFVAYPYHLPVCIGMIKARSDFSPQKSFMLTGSPSYLASEFWKAYDKAQACLVTFSGRGFDMPVMEMAAFEHGIKVPPQYWGKNGPRSRFGEGHIDILDFLTNFGAAPYLSGGLNLLSKLLGRKGKTDIDGRDVHQLIKDGRIDKVTSYCMDDVVDTYAAFLRTRVLKSELEPKLEEAFLEHALSGMSNEAVQQCEAAHEEAAKAQDAQGRQGSPEADAGN